MTATADIQEEIVEKWQEIVDLLSDFFRVPAALIMKTEGRQTEVFVASQSEGNPYQRGQRASLDSRVYCKTVMRTRKCLVVPNALEDDEWKSSPCVGLGMISYLGFPVIWPNGEVFGTICLLDAKPNAYSETVQSLLKQFRDVLEADLKALALERAKTEWERTFDAVPDLIAILDSQYGIVRVNRAMAERMRLPPDQCVGLSCYRHVHGTDKPPSYCPYTQSLKDGREYTTEIHEDGLGGDFLVSVSPLFGADGCVRGAVHVARDITERKRMVETLTESEQRFRGLAERSFDLVFMTDMEGRITYVSPAVQRVFCAAPEEVMGRNFTEFLVESEIPRASELFAKTLTGEDVGIIEMEVIAEGGERRFVELNATLVLEDNQAVGTQGVIRDVTDRRRAQEQLKEWEKQLVYMGRLSTMAEIVIGLAHELRQPLYAITNYATAIKLQLQNATADPQELADVAQRISGQARRASDTIARLRSDARKCEPHKSSMGINELLNDLSKIVEYELRQEGISIHVDLQERLPLVCVDAIQIQQVALNLIRNAVDAMRGISSRKKRLTLTTSIVDGEGVEVCVSDTGAGLSDEVRHKMFDAFFTTKPEGLGMGLAISRTIVEAHEGRIWATPNPPHGTAFHFVIPTPSEKN